MPEDLVHYAMLAELSQVMYPDNASALKTPSFDIVESGFGRPLLCNALHKWESGTRSTLQLKENSISVEPWQMAVCGDFIGERNPSVEAAAISGLEAADRVLGWMVDGQGKS